MLFITFPNEESVGELDCPARNGEVSRGCICSGQSQTLSLVYGRDGIAASLYQSYM
jgi:hypothetical protein